MKARGLFRVGMYLAAALALVCVALAAARAAMQMARSYTGNHFNGVIGFTYKESQPAWPALPAARPGSPNVVIFLLDDVGFANLAPTAARFAPRTSTGWRRPDCATTTTPPPRCALPHAPRC